MKKLIRLLTGSTSRFKHFIGGAAGKLTRVRKIKTTTLKEIAKGIAVAAGAGTLTHFLVSNIENDDLQQREQLGSAITREDGTVDFAAKRRALYADIHATISLLVKNDLTSHDRERYVQLMHDFVCLVSLHPNEKTASLGLTGLEIFNNLYQAGSGLEEAADNPLIVRHVMNRSEDGFSPEDVEGNLLTMMDLADSGAPLY